MPGTYLDFDVLIEHAVQGYRAKVLDSPTGQAAADFSLPFSTQEMEIFLLRLTRSLSEARRRVRRLESQERELVKGFGGRLFQAMFSGAVLGALQGSLNEAFRKDAGLRIRLRLTDTPELADVPWEFLFNPVGNRFLNLSPDTPLIRYLDLPMPVRPLAVTPPLRVLVMISSPADFPQLDVGAEWDRLNAALGDLIKKGLVSITRLPSASLAALQRPLRLEKYHIFHFIGHGGFDEQAQDGALALEDAQGRARLVTGQDLGVMLSDHRSLRLTVLNACEGARAASADPFAGVAQSLVQQGIPAVIAMQFEITDDAAITFAGELYAAIADGYPVDAALGEARRAIFASGNDVEWATPVLYTRSPNGQLFRVTRRSAEAGQQARDEAEREQVVRGEPEREGAQRVEGIGDQPAQVAVAEPGGPEEPEQEEAEREEPQLEEAEQAGKERPPRRRRRALIGAAAVAALLVVGGTAVALLMSNRTGSPPDRGGTGRGEFTAESPWRLVVRDEIDVNDNGCTVTVTNTSAENTEGPFVVRDLYGEKSFQVHETGTFRWEANDPGCLVIRRSGAGNAVLPFAWPAWTGDTDAFEAPGQIVVEVEDFQGGTECDLKLHDAEDGQLVNFGTATEDGDPLILDPQGRPEVYLADLECGVRVSTG